MKGILKILTIFSLFTYLCACSGTPDAASVPPEQTKPLSEPTIAQSQGPNETVGPSEQPNETISPSEQPEQGQSLTSLIPEGWAILEKSEGAPVQAIGDLNKDETDDIAVIIEKERDTEEQAPLKAILIAFGKGNNEYTLSIVAEKAVLKADAGGVWGDPLEGISIDRGSVLISYYGGSNHRWYETYRFRFQDQDWYLIGATLGSYHTGRTTIEHADEEDYNLLTGDFTVRQADEHDPDQVTTTKGNRGKAELLKLKDFDAEGGKDQFLNDRPKAAE